MSRAARDLFVLCAVSALFTLLPVAAAHADTLRRTGLTLTCDPTVTVGDSVALHGRLDMEGRPPFPPVNVTLSVRAAGEAAFVPLGSLPLVSDGSFSYSDAPERTSTYRVEFWGDEALGLPPADPAEATVEVSFAVTLKIPAVFWLRETGRVGGTVRPARPAGTAVTVQLWVGDAWATIGSPLLNEESAFELEWVARRAGGLRFRALMPADEGNAEGVSSVSTSRARDSNPHRVPKTMRRTIVIDHSEYRLYYYEYGHIVRDFPCVLGKPSTPTPLGRFRIYRKIPHPGGPNGAYYMKYRGIIGIHGTNAPQLLTRFPRAYSHGCARLYDRDITWLYLRCPLGTNVWSVR